MATTTTTPQRKGMLPLVFVLCLIVPIALILIDGIFNQGRALHAITTLNHVFITLPPNP
jgi:hypothetical membrane protein